MSINRSPIGSVEPERTDACSAAPPAASVVQQVGARDAAHPSPVEHDEAGPESAVLRRRVLVALHRDGPLHRVIQMGRLVAGAIHAPLHGLFVGPTPIDASEVPEHVGVDPEALRGLVLDIAAGDPGEVLAARLIARGATFVVIPSAAGRSAQDRLGVGELARRAIEIAAGGVILLDPSTRAPALRRILLPLDGTPSTAAAIAPVGELARSLGAELDVVLVGEAHPDLAHAAEPGAMSPPRYVDQPHHEWAAFHEEFLQRFLGAIGHVPLGLAKRFFLSAGEPAAEILRLAAELDSDLVALAWHGTLNSTHGAIFRDVVRGAPCPVLVLRC